MNRKRKTRREGCEYAIWIKQCLGYFSTDTINERTAGGSEKGEEPLLRAENYAYCNLYKDYYTSFAVCPL